MPPLRLPRVELRWRYALPVVVAACAVAAGVWLYRSPLLTVRHVDVQGNGTVSTDAIQATAGLDGQSLINPDFAVARQRLMAVPLIKDARVTRDWPFGVKITIVERMPWGVWRQGGQNYVIDDEGVVLGLPVPQGSPAITQLDAGAPLSSGSRVDSGAVAVAARLVPAAQQTLGRSVTALEFTQGTGLTVILDGSLRVAFGDAQAYDYKLATLFAVLQKAQEEGRALHSVDLRFGELVAVQ